MCLRVDGVLDVVWMFCTVGVVRFVCCLFCLLIRGLRVSARLESSGASELYKRDDLCQCFWALRRVGVWSVCLCHVCYGRVFFVERGRFIGWRPVPVL